MAFCKIKRKTALDFVEAGGADAGAARGGNGVWDGNGVAVGRVSRPNAPAGRAGPVAAKLHGLDEALVAAPEGDDAKTPDERGLADGGRRRAEVGWQFDGGPPEGG